MIAIKEIGLKREQASEFVKNNICSICEGFLTLAWGGFYGSNEYFIRCGHDKAHNGFRKQKTILERMEDRNGK